MKRSLLFFAVLALIVMKNITVLAEDPIVSFGYDTFIKEYGEPGFLWDNDTWKQFADGLRVCGTLSNAPEYLQYIALHEYETPAHVDTESYRTLSAAGAIECAQQECKRQGIRWENLRAYVIGLKTVMEQRALWKVTLYDEHTRYTICVAADGGFIEPLTKADEQTPWYSSFVLSEVLQYNDLANAALDARVLPREMERQIENELKSSTLVSLILSDLHEYGLPPNVMPLVYPDRLDVEARLDPSGAADSYRIWPAKALMHIDLVNRIHDYIERRIWNEEAAFQLYDPGVCYLCVPGVGELDDKYVREYAEQYGLNNRLGKIIYYSACCFADVYNINTQERYDKVWVLHVRYQNERDTIYVINMDAKSGQTIEEVIGSCDGSVG